MEKRGLTFAEKAAILQPVTSIEQRVTNFAYNPSIVLGHGSFALVYKGRRMVEPHDEVAVKVIAKLRTRDKNKGLISKEIQILKNLSKMKHDNIVKLHECHETDTHVYLVMEYCYGGDLNDYLQAQPLKKPLSESTMKIFTEQIARGIRICYLSGIAHRDLKPQNILMDIKGRHRYPPPHELTLKIADFGFARFIEHGSMAETLCGSPMYMAPEVLMSLKYTSSVDLFSLGTILYQCFTGNPPFAAKSPQELKEFYQSHRGKWEVFFPDDCAKAPELRHLLKCLLKVEKDRISYENFFTHPFVNLEPIDPSSLLSGMVPSLANVNKSPLGAEGLGTATSGMPRPSKQRLFAGALPSTPEELEHQSSRPDESPYRTPQRPNANALVKGPRHADVARPADAARPTEYSTPLDECDDFVLVPRNIPSDNDPARTRTGVVNMAVARRRPSVTSPVHQKLLRAASAPQQTGQAFPHRGHHAAGNANATCTGLPDCLCESCQEGFCYSFNDNDGSGSASGRSSGFTAGRNSNSSMKDVSADQSHTSESAPYRKISDINMPDISSLSPPSVQFCAVLSSPVIQTRRKSSSSNSATGQRYSPTGSPLHTSDIKSPAYFMPQTLYAYHGLPPVVPTAHRTDGAPDDNSRRDICGNISVIGRDRVAVSDPSHGDSSQIFLENFCKEAQVNMSVGSYSLQRSTTDPALLPNQSASMTDSSKQIMKYMGSGHETALGESTGFNLPVNTLLVESASYYAAPLCQETVMEKEHTETLTKLHFVLALIDCIFELAKSRSFFCDSPSILPRREAIFGERMSQNEEWQKKTEQLVLYVRALRLLSSAISMAQTETAHSRLKSSNAVEEATRVLTDNFNYCYGICRDLNRSGQVMHMDEETCAKVADKLLYYYSLDMCQNAAVNELFGQPGDSFKRYQTAQILLHALSQQVPEADDKRIISVYQKAVEKRLYILQSQGVVQAVRTNDDL